MSSTHPSTAPHLALAELALTKALVDSKTLLAFYAGGRHELAVILVTDLITATVHLVQDVQQGNACSPRLIETVTDLAKRFGRLSLPRRHLVVSLLMELVRSGARPRGRRE